MRYGQWVSVPVRRQIGWIELVIPAVMTGDETVYIVRCCNEQVPCYVSDIDPFFLEAEVV